MILITGHRGMIGSRLSKKIDAIGIDIQDGHNLLTCDLPKDVDTVFHLAAQTSVEASWADPMHDSDNLKMTVRLAHTYPNAKIIYANSAAALTPASSPYGFSKLAASTYLMAFHRNSVICTFPNVYGGTRSVVDIFNANENVTIYGDGEQIRDYVHVDDIVAGLLLAQDWPKGEYEMGSGIATSVNQLIKPRHKVTYAPARKEARESILSNTTPNWNPTIFL